MKAESLYEEHEFWHFFENAIVVSPALYQKILSVVEKHSDRGDDVIYYPLSHSFSSNRGTVILEFYLKKFFDGTKLVDQWLCETPIIILPYSKAESYKE